jgi:signal transduction histidine kinase
MDVSRTAPHVAEEAHAFHPSRRVVFTATGDCRGTWDETRLYQLLSNLVQNAIRHGDTEKPVKVEAVGKADEVQIAVHNDGAPIAQSKMRRIFEPMQQAENGSSRAEGLGLGLYIARAIATAHHGTIGVGSTTENGTTSTVRLPRHARAVVACRSSAVSQLLRQFAHHGRRRCPVHRAPPDRRDCRALRQPARRCRTR